MVMGLYILFSIIAPFVNNSNVLNFNIEDVYSVIDNTKIIKSFRDMFVADALIGNPDRHLDNWGLLYNIKTNSYIFSPIYDCESCLHE